MENAPNGDGGSLAPVDGTLRPPGAPPAGRPGGTIGSTTRPMRRVGVLTSVHDADGRQQRAPRWPTVEPDPVDARRQGLHRLRLATASLGVASLVGTGAVMAALVEPSTAAGGSDGGTSQDPSGDSPSTGATPTDGGLTAPVEPPGPAAPGPVDASSGAS